MSRFILAPALLLALQAWGAPPRAVPTEEVDAVGLLSGARVLDEEGRPWDTSVKKWLVGKSVPDKSLRTQGFGMSRPAARIQIRSTSSRTSGRWRASPPATSRRSRTPPR